jgi:hypothetical protein
MAKGVRFELTIRHPTFVHRILPGKRNVSKRLKTNANVTRPERTDDLVFLETAEPKAK